MKRWWFGMPGWLQMWWIALGIIAALSALCGVATWYGLTYLLGVNS